VKCSLLRFLFTRKLKAVHAMPDTFLYFAYGSNMLTRRLTAPRRAPSAVAIGTAFAEGRRLTFDKVSTDGSGKCDIEETGNPDDRVYGVLFRINSADIGGLDEAEGLGNGYRKGEIQVVTQSGPSTAVAYFATEKDTRRRPYDWYKAFVVHGAIENRLPDAYIESLQVVSSQRDPDAARRARNEAVLSG
jgi:gamma-glutamylcyclotransferase